MFDLSNRCSVFEQRYSSIGMLFISINDKNIIIHKHYTLSGTYNPMV